MMRQAGSKRSITDHRFVRGLGISKISLVYLYVVIFVVFAIMVPGTWLSATTHKTIVNQQAIIALATIGVVPALLADVFDLSIGGMISIGAVTAAWALNRGWPTGWAIVLVLVLSALFGLLNAFLVVKLRIFSIIATLGTGAILDALASWRSGGQTLIITNTGFAHLSQESWAGFQLPVLYVVVIGVIMWYVIEHTPTGRYIEAAGSGPESARLAGVRVERYQVGALVVSATMSGLVGVLLASQISSATPDLGDAYILPAYSAAILGATQFRSRANVWGALVGVVVLASGVKGLQLAGATQAYVSQLFFGLALVIALGVGSVLSRRTGMRDRARRDESQSAADDAVAEDEPPPLAELIEHGGLAHATVRETGADDG